MDKIRDKNGLTEEEFLEKYKEKNYPRPYLTADIVVIVYKYVGVAGRIFTPNGNYGRNRTQRIA